MPNKREFTYTINCESQDAAHAAAVALRAAWDFRTVTANVFQCERGAGGNHHVQGTIRFKDKMGFDAVCAYLHDATGIWAHVEECRDWAASVAYCTKADTRVGDTYELGVIEKRTGASAWTHIPNMLERGATDREIAGRFPAEYARCSAGIARLRAAIAPRAEELPPVVHVWCGHTGGGKSHAARQWLRSEGHPDPYIKPNGQWWDGWTGQRGIIFDDFDPTRTPFTDLLQVLDRYGVSVQVKGGFVFIQPTHIAITCGDHPKDWYKYDKYGGANYDHLQRRLTAIHNVTRAYPGLPLVPQEDWDGSLVPPYGSTWATSGPLPSLWGGTSSLPLPVAVASDLLAPSYPVGGAGRRSSMGLDMMDFV